MRSTNSRRLSRSSQDSEAKHAEVARLFDLFERLADRRPRVLIDAAEEFAALTRSYADRSNAGQGTTLARLISTTSPNQINDNLEATAASFDSTSIDEEALAFPFSEQYPFTFKMMIHKLYEMDVWADKVRDVLERSKKAYKPLGEVAVNTEEKREEFDVLGLSQLLKESRNHPLVSPKSGRRPRGYSVGLRLPTKVLSPIQATFPRVQELDTDSGRVLKKRCVGRRKSLTAPLRNAHWIYDAAVSAVEFAVENIAPFQRRRFESLESPAAARKAPYVFGTSRARVASELQGALGVKPGDTAPMARNRKRAVTIAGLNAGAEVVLREKRPFLAM